MRQGSEKIASNVDNSDHRRAPKTSDPVAFGVPMPQCYGRWLAEILLNAEFAPHGQDRAHRHREEYYAATPLSHGPGPKSKRDPIIEVMAIRIDPKGDIMSVIHVG